MTSETTPLRAASEQNYQSSLAHARSASDTSYLESDRQIDVPADEVHVSFDPKLELEEDYDEFVGMRERGRSNSSIFESLGEIKEA
jgi:hypothetical protein